MTQEQIIETVQSELGIDGITLDTTLDSLGVDSLGFMELMLKCEVPREKEVGIETVGDIVKAVAV
jgi:acyl carrier protein